MRPWLHRLTFAVVRYAPAELVGTATMIVCCLIARRYTHDVLVLALVAILTESVGFYGVIGGAVLREQWTDAAGHPRRVRRTVLLSGRLLLAEFGPAELVDTFTRPPVTATAIWLIGPTIPGFLAAKVGSDLVFYAAASGGYALTCWIGWRGPRPEPEIDDLRQRRRDEVRALLVQPQVRQALELQGTPLAVLEPRRAADAYRRLQAAFPYVRFHYAVKALDHVAVIDAVARQGGWFDVASDAERLLVLSRGIPADRVMHTHPVKTDGDIERAVASGVTTFVVDSVCEIEKFARLRPTGVRLLVRLAFRNPSAVSDLSAKFGADPRDAVTLVRSGLQSGLDMCGFSFHVGSQVDSVTPFRDAVAETLKVMGRVEAVLGHRLTVLDIGGGFPASYQHEAVSVEQIAQAVGPLLAPLAGRLDIWAEPGRAIAADAVTVVAGVTGVAERDGVAWSYINDGVYGLWSNMIWERVRPLVLTGPEIVEESRPRRVSVIAGPTCDSIDVVVRDSELPVLQVGDLVVSPTMGAYTMVTATTFNGRPPAAVVVVGAEELAAEAVA